MDLDRPKNQDIIEAWVQRHQMAAWRYLRLLGCQADIADDLLQDALMAAVHKNIHCEPGPRASAWLQQALRNLWRMHCRSEGRRVRNIETAMAERAMQQCSSDDDGECFRTALRDCLKQLDGRARQLLDLHYAQGASREAIAATFGMRRNGIKAFLRRVRSSLRDCVLRQLQTAPELGL